MSKHSVAHTIRLRRPWEKQIGGQSSERIDVPEIDLANTVQTMEPPEESTYRRRFNQPTGLTENTAVELEIQSWVGRLISVQVNDYSVPFDGNARSVRANISSMLSPHNLLTIRIAPHDGASTDHKVLLNGAVNLLITQLDSE